MWVVFVLANAKSPGMALIEATGIDVNDSDNDNDGNDNDNGEGNKYDTDDVMPNTVMMFDSGQAIELIGK